MVDICQSLITTAKREAPSERGSSFGPITIAPNSSARIEIPLAGAGADVPRISYSIACGDQFGGLLHHIANIYADKFVLFVDNQVIGARTIIITFEATRAK